MGFNYTMIKNNLRDLKLNTVSSFVFWFGIGVLKQKTKNPLRSYGRFARKRGVPTLESAGVVKRGLLLPPLWFDALLSLAWQEMNPTFFFFASSHAAHGRRVHAWLPLLLREDQQKASTFGP